MNRVEFTKNLLRLLARMFAEGERPLVDYVKRSAQEQNRLYNLGLSDCDGYNKPSRHQAGRAVDIYFLTEDGRGIEPPQKGFEYWHEYWERLGGKPMLGWDRGHFEV